MCTKFNYLHMHMHCGFIKFNYQLRSALKEVILFIILFFYVLDRIASLQDVHLIVRHVKGRCQLSIIGDEYYYNDNIFVTLSMQQIYDSSRLSI